MGLRGMPAGSRLLSHSHIRGKETSDHVNSSLVHRGTPTVQLQIQNDVLGRAGQRGSSTGFRYTVCETASLSLTALHQLRCPSSSLQQPCMKIPMFC